MNCPVCANTQLVLSERQGVEIDYCPQCRGVWLDRGELDKIIERSYPMKQTSVFNNHGDGHHDKHCKEDHHGGHYKKKGFLSDLFD